MRYLVEAAIFAVIFILARMVFESSFIAFLAGGVVAGAAETMRGVPRKR